MIRYYTLMSLCFIFCMVIDADDKTIAMVRTSNDLCSSENAYRERRHTFVKNAVEQIVQQSVSDDQVPVVALVASGGGFRAMTASMGSFLGAQKIGLLDATTYMVGLSGSTWLIAPWVSVGRPLQEYKDMLTHNIKKGLRYISLTKLPFFIQSLLTKKRYKQPTGFIDFYGALLANVLLKDFGKDRYNVHLSDQAAIIDQTDIPFPIYTSVRAEPYATSQWYEFTPYEVGASWMASYVPSWSFNRSFNNGVSVDEAPEQSLGFLLGTFGSAMGATISNIHDYFQDHHLLDVIPDAFENVIIDEFGQDRFVYSEVNNFTYGMPSSPVGDLSVLKMVDAGAQPGFNLPYPPISGERPERKADIIIFLDMSWPLSEAKELKSAEQYAYTNNLKFPTIDYTDIDKKACSIFIDEADADIPIVIYMPLINDTTLWKKLDDPLYAHYKSEVYNFDIAEACDHGFASTFNFYYTPDEFRQLSALTEFTMVVHEQIIKDTIAKAVARKS